MSMSLFLNASVLESHNHPGVLCTCKWSLGTHAWSCTSVVGSDVVELRLIFHSTEHFSVTFRTSRAKNDNGFELSVICFDPINTNKAGVYVVCVCVSVCTWVHYICVCTIMCLYLDHIACVYYVPYLHFIRLSVNRLSDPISNLQHFNGK